MTYGIIKYAYHGYVLNQEQNKTKRAINTIFIASGSHPFYCRYPLIKYPKI